MPAPCCDAPVPLAIADAARVFGCPADAAWSVIDRKIAPRHGGLETPDLAVHHERRNLVSKRSTINRIIPTIHRGAVPSSRS
jgi:hypothetical protein